MNARNTQLAIVVILAILAGFPDPVLAQGPRRGFDVQQFNPIPSRHLNYWDLASARVLEHLGWEAGLSVSYSDAPLTLVNENADDELIASIVASQLTLYLGGAIGLFDVMELGISLPLILVQSGDETALALDAPDAGFGVGDLYLVPRFELFSTETEEHPGGLTLGALASVALPLGDSNRFQGEGFRVEPRLVIDYALPSALRFSANLGYQFRRKTRFVDAEIDDSLTYGLAASIPIGERFALIPEVTGQAGILADELAAGDLPLEFLLGGRITPVDGWMFELGGGLGLVDGIGTPDFRLFAGLSWAPPVVKDHDSDGLLDDEDGCPMDPEDFDSFEDEDGCPDPDNDQDGLLDDADGCPREPEDFDSFEDEDGCPDPDNDRDGKLDGADGCPMEPEDFDSFEDEDGCPDPDNDQDGLLDGVDQCPNEPESMNGNLDEDGCPDSVVIQQCQSLDLLDVVYFDTDSDIIQERSFGLLNQVAGLLNAHLDVTRVRVEGHTDNRNTDEYNMDLSQRRAQAVISYLVLQGVAADRLVAQGYGETRPIADNGTEEGMAQNRRVLFTILSQDGCAEITPPY